MNLGFVFGLALALGASAQPLAVQLPPFSREVLPNKVVVCLMPKADARMLGVRVTIRGGAEADPADLPGLSSIVVSLLTRGTTTRTADQFASEVDFLGAKIQGFVDAQSSTIALDVLPANASAGIALLSDAILRPKFAGSEVSRQVARSIELARKHKDSPGDAVWQYFRSFFFLPPHPYGRPFWGDELTLERIGQATVDEHYARMYVGRNVIVTAVGPFEEAQLRPVLTKAFIGLAPGDQYKWRGEPPARPGQSRLLLIDKPDATETQFIIGLPGITRTDPDRVTLWLVNNILGGRFTSLLNERLRVESGLTYGAYSYLQQDRLSGGIMLHSYTATADTVRAVDVALGVLRKFANEGVSADQLAAARNCIETAYPSEHLETAGQLADILADLELYGLGPDEINTLFARLDGVTVADANRVVKGYFAVNTPVLVLIGQAEHIRGQLRGYDNSMMEGSITEPGFTRQTQHAR